MLFKEKATKTNKNMSKLDWGDVAGGLALETGGAAVNNLMNEVQMERTFGYNEAAAKNADKRTRALFTDLYSPQAKVKQLKDAGLSVGMMYGQGGASGTTSTAGAQGAGAGSQQAAHVNLGDKLQLGMMKAQIDNLNANTAAQEQETLKKQEETRKLGEEIEKIQQEVKNLVGEKALQGWSQRQLMTISDSELNSYSEGAGWNKGWSEGTSQGTSASESKQGGASVGVKVMGSGGTVSGNYGYSESGSQNTSENRSENKGANTNKSETTSTSGSRNVVVWPEYGENGKLKEIYIFILTGDYQNIQTEFRRD